MQSAASLLDRHPDAEVLCIDMFDTISTRSVAQPTHVFALMEQELVGTEGSRWRGFAVQRVIAEDRARHTQLEIDDRADVNLSAIYSALAVMLGLSHSDAHRLAQMEVEWQVRVAQPVPFGVELANLARHRGMKVQIISDNYMSSDVIARLAHAVGLDWVTTGHVTVSCEHGGMKHNGWLWKSVLDQLGVDPARILHVGDDAHADGVMPASFGIASEVRAHSRRSQRLPINTHVNVLPHSRLEAAYRNLVITDSWDDAESIGSTMMAMIVARQVARAMDIVRTNPDARIYFAARDGWVAHQVWQRLRDSNPTLPIAAYLSFSRNVVWRADMHVVGDEEAKKFIGDDELLTPRQLGSRFGCEFPHAAPDEPMDAGTARELLIAHDHRVLGGADKLRVAFTTYLQSVGILNPGHHVVFDLGWKGSAVADLAEFVSTATNGASTVEGVFTGLYWDAVSQRTRLAMSADSVDDLMGLDDNLRLLGCLRMVEALVTAPMGSVVGFSELGEPLLADSPVEMAGWKSVVERAVARAIDTVVDIANGVHPSGVRLDDITPGAVWASIMQMGQSPRIDEVLMLSKLRHVTSIDHADDGDCLIGEPPEIPEEGIHPVWLGEVFDVLQHRHWMQGTIAAWRHHEISRPVADAILETWPAFKPEWVAS